MKIIVSGGTGFIGSHFLAHALDEGHELIAIRRHGARPRIPLADEIRWIEADIPDVDLTQLGDLRTFSFVHLAAHGVDPSRASWESSFRFNVHDSLDLWMRAIECGVSRFTICGSCFEYGMSGERYDFIPVDAPLEPTGPYHASKAAASMAALGLAVHKKLELTLVRPFHIFGEGEEAYRLWPALRDAALSGADFPMTPGEQVRDFMPVEMLAEFLLNTVDSPPPKGSPLVLNAGTGEPRTIREFAESWWSHWGAAGKLLLGALPYREGEVMRYVPQITTPSLR